ncbi:MULTISPECIES: YceI family protein [unclassified Variovorax]|jgi:polyisoprenoid-binding protein YceI|uniref:YceI family protein n=1 Tax=unclassified Variovorax TaxID=663243 RepID=UPI000F7F2AB3|nr:MULTISPECIES: YceI family protein [unclassified Variovorax]RSZ42642.1 YceI family protein [Variovorax sp. 553]RSZ43617.1 YceI family protein [Variovorax sp. 679]
MTMKMKLPLFTPALALAMALPAGAEPPAAKLVADKSQIVFVSKQMGVPVEGTFKKFDAHVAFDPKKPEGGSIVLQIDTASAGFGVPMSDAELPKQPWFDAAHFPQASFQSSAIKALGEGRFEMAGKLTIKGTSKNVTVPVSIAPAPGGNYAVVTGSLTIQRLDYKVGDGEWTDTSMVGNEVQVRFRFTLAGLGPL